MTKSVYKQISGQVFCKNADLVLKLRVEEQVCRRVDERILWRIEGFVWWPVANGIRRKLRGLA